MANLNITQYWDLTFPAADQTYTRSEDDLAEEVRERFRRSVEAQMVSDVPIGAFLSAGLDSSSIVAMMRARDEPAGSYLYDHVSREVPSRRDNAGRS